MESTETFSARSRKIAMRFLQTAVVVDDEAYMAVERSDGPKGDLEIPGRHSHASSHENQSPAGRGPKHTLNARPVIDSFSELGVICGVVGPTQSAMEVMRQADIVVLDWLLQDGDPQHALSLLRDLLTGEVDRNSLRLVAIYTGEPGLEDIYKTIFDQLKEDELGPKGNGSKTAISYRHGRVVLYAKSDVNLVGDLKERSIAEEELPERLVEDFTEMTEGLLPRIALTSLTAVREGAHMVLDRFCADLDPAFLAHRVCLDNPDDAEQHIVNHVAEELRGLMDNAVAAQSPAGAKAVEDWIRNRKGGATEFKFCNKYFSIEETVALTRNGLNADDLEANGQEVSKTFKTNAFEGLSAGFAGSKVVDLDQWLAWIMSFRTVFNEPPPRLWLGSVVTATVNSKDKHLICMRPRCDCVRLEGETTFFFLPLVAPQKMKEQLVVRLDSNFKRLGIDLDPAGWFCRQFKPSEGASAVTAIKEDTSGLFVFKDMCNERYVWQGELKAEYAQRIAQTFTTPLSRVAVDESEWLRRMAKKESR